ncbi:MAG: hypothetical protein GX197_07070 [Firmicutes bacterium]|nr:hypothetical protein [Bacillota bacterium]
MIVLVTKRFWRWVLFFLILIFVLPLVHFYWLQAIQPESTVLPRPSLPVVAENVDGLAQNQLAARFRYYLHEFYQNGL